MATYAPKVVAEVTCDITPEMLLMIRKELHEYIDAALDAINEKLSELKPKEK